jgi:hypothetical protein
MPRKKNTRPKNWLGGGGGGDSDFGWKGKKNVAAASAGSGVEADVIKIIRCCSVG